MTERLLNAREVAHLLGFAPATIVDWTEAGKIPSFKVGGRLRFRESELDAWLEEQRQGPSPRTRTVASVGGEK
jgi:excisionase family DNA binding protein